MTWALCFACGHRKFGALVPCPACGTGSTGDFDLDIAFSDHQMSVRSIEQFGDVVREIAKRTEDEKVRFWAFMKYVSDGYPQVLRVEIGDEVRAQVEEVIARGPLPVVQYRPRIRLGRFVVLIGVLLLLAAAVRRLWFT